MFRVIRILILLLTWVGLSARAADLPSRIHESHQEVCEHPHEHDHEDDTPCQESHHHCHCQNLPPLFCLPEFPLRTNASILSVSSAKPERTQWELPDDPVYDRVVPPIIN